MPNPSSRGAGQRDIKYPQSHHFVFCIGIKNPNPDIAMIW